MGSTARQHTAVETWSLLAAFREKIQVSPCGLVIVATSAYNISIGQVKHGHGEPSNRCTSIINTNFFADMHRVRQLLSFPILKTERNYDDRFTQCRCRNCSGTLQLKISRPLSDNLSQWTYNIILPRIVF
jgi:hypothetical protein